MNDIDNRESIQGGTSVQEDISLQGAHQNDHVPPKVAVYDRPQEKRPSLWQFVIMAVLLLVAAVIVYQLIF